VDTTLLLNWSLAVTLKAAGTVASPVAVTGNAKVHTNEGSTCSVTQLELLAPMNSPFTESTKL